LRVVAFPAFWLSLESTADVLAGNSSEGRKLFWTTLCTLKM